ncbi:hypothetical protein [Palleronia caenipelagi]|uniref:Uncharacterized protein n=1 Tax=Palleronia caenipelagi TaxID=2489174 RepID=A0A547Q6C3_9RHOB|nr:hypothetical protein [Palleronia caenipelagi]TRD21910.1 hypothetical protein FEV53_07625 [Palleronia caenipelagi]
MVKVIIHRTCNATDPKRGVSLRLSPSEKPQSLPAWAADLAVKSGAAERIPLTRKSPARAQTRKGS